MPNSDILTVKRSGRCAEEDEWMDRLCYAIAMDDESACLSLFIRELDMYSGV